MNYSIHLTKKAEYDLEDAANYIEYVLKNPGAADQLLDLAEEKISALSRFPQNAALANDRVLAAWGIRFINVNHYLAFFIVNEVSHCVYIIRFLYGRRDWISILRTAFSMQ